MTQESVTIEGWCSPRKIGTPMFAKVFGPTLTIDGVQVSIEALKRWVAQFVQEGRGEVSTWNAAWRASAAAAQTERAVEKAWQRFENAMARPADGAQAQELSDVLKSSTFAEAVELYDRQWQASVGFKDRGSCEKFLDALTVLAAKERK